MQHWNVPKKNRHRGFTLIEMLAVVVMVGILAAIAIPNLLGLIYKARIDDGLADIEGAIKEAKGQATRFSQGCWIEIGTDTIDGETRYTVETSTGTGSPANNSRCLLEKRILPTGVEVAENFGTSKKIKYSGKGNIGNTNEYAPANTGSWTITVSHDNISTSKCLRVEGLFGDVQTGIIQGGACNTNL
jgi:prepilin-type N-terminal cleavage/methylation domain-containing protein